MFYTKRNYKWNNKYNNNYMYKVILGAFESTECTIISLDDELSNGFGVPPQDNYHNRIKNMIERNYYIKEDTFHESRQRPRKRFVISNCFLNNNQIDILLQLAGKREFIPCDNIQDAKKMLSTHHSIQDYHYDFNTKLLYPKYN